MDAQFLQRGGHEGHAAEVIEALAAGGRQRGSLGEGPEVGHDVAGDAAAAVGDADDDVFLGLADGDLDGRRRRRRVVPVPHPLVDHRLHGVAQQFADDVFEVAEDVGEGGLEVPVDADLGDLHVGSVG